MTLVDGFCTCIKPTFSQSHFFNSRYDKHDYDMELKDTNVPPKFLLPLVDQSAKKGDTVTFSVTGKHTTCLLIKLFFKLYYY